MTEHPLFLLGFCLMLTHEMDAIRCREGRIFPLTARMGEEVGYVAFTAFHVPLYAFLLWGLYGGARSSIGWCAASARSLSSTSFSISSTAVTRSTGSDPPSRRP